VWYQRADLERALPARFHEATTPSLLEVLTRAVPPSSTPPFQNHDERVAGVKAELLRHEREAAVPVISLSTLAVSSPPDSRHEASSSGRRKLPVGGYRRV
jgi:hypothetical protein